MLQMYYDFYQDFDDSLVITDYKGTEEGTMIVAVTPVTQNGKTLDEDNFVDDPSELLGKPFHFKVEIRCAEIHKARFAKGTKIKFRVYKDEAYSETKMVKGSLTPEYGFNKVLSFSKIGQEHLDFFDTGSITFMLYGLQEDGGPDNRKGKMTTKVGIYFIFFS